MPFFMVDDQLHVNRKTEALIDMGQTGLAALGLWTLIGSVVQAQTGADGRVSDTAWRKVGDKRTFTKLAKVLVDVGSGKAATTASLAGSITTGSTSATCPARRSSSTASAPRR
jgi:hypothetical protein